MATIEEAEDLEKQVTIEASRGGMRVMARLTGRGLDQLRESLALVVRTVQGHNSGGQRKPGELPSVKAFGAKVSGQDRDVVDIGNKRVLNEVRGELRRSGVDFAIEKTKEGHVLHFRTSDAKVLAAALERASDRVDARTAEATAKRDIAQEIEARINPSEREGEARERTRDDERDQAREVADELKLEGDTPALDGATVSLEPEALDGPKLEAPVMDGPELGEGLTR